MTNSYFVRVTRAYSDVSGMIMDWAARSAKIVCYEHVGTETEKVHIHVLIVDAEVEKKMLKTLVSRFGLKGNGDWSWKQRKDLSDTPMVYMTKGKLDPVYLKGYTQQDADNWKSRWVEKCDQTIWEKVVDYCYDDKDYMEQWINNYMDARTIAMNQHEIRFHCLLKYTQAMIFMYNKRIWSPAAINQYKTCVLTYVMRNDMLIPPSYKDWNKNL